MYRVLDTWNKALSQTSLDEKEYRICKSVLDCLYNNKVYLDPKLSLTKFCSIVGTNTTYLSNAVNNVFGCNLRFLINWYRVEYAKSLLSELPAKVKELPATCGFASKSTFYASFKKMENMTPLQFIMLQRERNPEFDMNDNSLT